MSHTCITSYCLEDFQKGAPGKTRMFPGLRRWNWLPRETKTANVHREPGKTELHTDRAQEICKRSSVSLQLNLYK